MATNGKAPQTTRQVGDLAMQVMSIQGNPYAKVNQRVESAHAKGGYTVISREFKEIFKKQVCEVWIELPNGQRFPGIAELDPTKSKILHDAETSAIGRALAFAGFDIHTAIASHEEMEDFLKQRGQTTIVEADAALPEPDPWEPARQLAKQLGYDAQRWNALVHQQVTGTPDKALRFLQEQARSLLNKRAAEQESEEDAHLIPDEMLVEALNS